MIVLKFVQFSNTQPSYCDVDTSVFLPKSVTLPGISIDVSEIQIQYLQPIITQYFIDNKSEIWLLFLIAH
ncbi:hypothetical protein ABHZ81_25745, partial [Bacteroides thetaiotaomicron]|uniref:hypothetical protein n=3 Tax=Bacteroides thetaiotaomicron TaxID=818 RepID=UPI0032615D9F